MKGDRTLVVWFTHKCVWNTEPEVIVQAKLKGFRPPSNPKDMLLGKWFPQPRGYRRTAKASEDEQYEWTEVNGVELRIPPKIKVLKPVSVSNSYQQLQESSASDAVGDDSIVADGRPPQNVNDGRVVVDSSDVSP